MNGRCCYSRAWRRRLSLQYIAALQYSAHHSSSSSCPSSSRVVADDRLPNSCGASEAEKAQTHNYHQPTKISNVSFKLLNRCFTHFPIHLFCCLIHGKHEKEKGKTKLTKQNTHTQKKNQNTQKHTKQNQQQNIKQNKNKALRIIE